MYLGIDIPRGLVIIPLADLPAFFGNPVLETYQMGTFSIVSVHETLFVGALEYNSIDMAVRTARANGRTPYLWVSFQKLLNNGVEDPSKPFRHDWRFTSGGEACFEVERGHAGLANALAKAMNELACQGDGCVNFPCAFGVSCSPDGIDWS